jgi:hypothetical protein
MKLEEEITPRIVRLLEKASTILAFLLGIALTVVIFDALYGELAFTQLFKGLSIQNTIDTIVTLNISELIIFLYFIVLFIVSFVAKKISIIALTSIKERQKPETSNWFLFHRLQSIISNVINSFREGSLIIPVVVMVFSSLTLQIILPVLIYSVVIVLLVLPFAIIGELYSFSKESLKSMITSIKDLFSSSKESNDKIINYEKGKPKIRKLLSLVGSIIGVVCVYPIAVFLIVDSGLDNFLNLVHYNLLWENPDSPIALMFWDFVNPNKYIDYLIVINNSDYYLFALVDIPFLDVMLDFWNSFFMENKYFLVTLIILIVTSQLYLFTKRIIKERSMRLLEKYALTYQ